MRLFAIRTFSTVWAPATFAVLATSLSPVAANAAQEEQITLVIQQGGREIGRETSTRRTPRARGLDGSILTSTARYGGAARSLSATLERTGTHALAKFQMDTDSGGTSTRIRAAGSGNLLVIRTEAKGSESGRELPGGPDVVLLDDGVYALYAQLADLATSEGKRLTGIFPRTGRRAAFTARRESAEGGGTRVVLEGGLAGTLTVDANGQLVRLELPSLHILVIRASASSSSPSR